MHRVDEHFYVGYCSQEATLDVINVVFEEQKYLMDTHTAVAFDVVCQYKQSTGDNTPCLIASTASPYKFSDSVINALDYPVNEDVFENVAKINEISGLNIPASLLELKNKAIRFDGICHKEEMDSTILDWVKNNG